MPIFFSLLGWFYNTNGLYPSNIESPFNSEIHHLKMQNHTECAPFQCHMAYATNRLKVNRPWLIPWSYWWWHKHKFDIQGNWYCTCCLEIWTYTYVITNLHVHTLIFRGKEECGSADVLPLSFETKSKGKGEGRCSLTVSKECFIDVQLVSTSCIWVDYKSNSGYELTFWQRFTD